MAAWQHVRTPPSGGSQLLAGPCDLGSPPPPAILLLDRQELARGTEAGVAPGVLQHQQREQPTRLGLGRHQLDQLPGEARSRVDANAVSAAAEYPWLKAR